MEILELMQQRHSVRQYTDKPIEAEKRQALAEEIAEINQKNGLNIQIIYDEPKCFSSFMAHYGKFSGVANYIALVGKKSPDLDVKLGYYGELLVIKAQELGLNTCWVALTHGKCAANVARDEKLVCLISLGYGQNQGMLHKNKHIKEISNYSPDMPKWFMDGIEATLLAPTAMNQQKFFLEMHPDGQVYAKCGKGFYTKLDLGIIKYHFEAVSGHTVNL